MRELSASGSRGEIAAAMEVFVVFDTMGDARILGVFESLEQANAIAKRDAHYIKVHRCELNAIDEEAIAWSRKETIPPPSSSSTPSTLFQASWLGDTRAVESCFAAGVDAREQRDGLTPLHMAACAGRADVVMRLLKAGADADAEAWDRDVELEPLWALLARRARRDFFGSLGVTPLHLACDGLHVEIVRMLLDRGADARLFVLLDNGPEGSFAWTPKELACPPAEHSSQEGRAIADMIDEHLARHPESERAKLRQKRRIDAAW